MGLKTIDCYFLHNPEMELDIVSRQTVLSRIKTLFVSLEKAVTDGLISMYGLATWHAFKVTSGGRNYLQLEELVNFAKDAAGNAFSLKLGKKSKIPLKFFCYFHICPMI